MIYHSLDHDKFMIGHSGIPDNSTEVQVICDLGGDNLYNVGICGEGQVMFRFDHITARSVAIEILKQADFVENGGK